MLGRNNNGLDPFRLVLIGVLDGHLRLGVRTQICDLIALSSQRSQFLQYDVGEIQCEWHIVLRLVGGITEHHSLVTCSLVFCRGAIHPLTDVFALLMDRIHHPAAVPVEHVLTLGVADAVDGVADDLLEVDQGL